MGLAVSGIIFHHFILQRKSEQLKSPLVGAGGLGSLSLPLRVTMLAFGEYLWPLSVLICVMGGREFNGKISTCGTLGADCSCNKGNPQARSQACFQGPGLPGSSLIL